MPPRWQPAKPLLIPSYAAQVRDFSLIFDALTAFEESLLAAKMEQGGDEDEEVEGEESDGEDFLLKDDGNDVDLRWGAGWREDCEQETFVVWRPLRSSSCCGWHSSCWYQNDAFPEGAALSISMPCWAFETLLCAHYKTWKSRNPHPKASGGWSTSFPPALIKEMAFELTGTLRLHQHETFCLGSARGINTGAA